MRMTRPSARGAPRGARPGPARDEMIAAASDLFVSDPAADVEELALANQSVNRKGVVVPLRVHVPVEPLGALAIPTPAAETAWAPRASARRRARTGRPRPRTPNGDSAVPVVAPPRPCVDRLIREGELSTSAAGIGHEEVARAAIISSRAGPGGHLVSTACNSAASCA